MNKYENVRADIYSVFSSSNWVAENIKTYPENFLAINAPSSYIRVAILPTKSGLNLKSVSGILIIDIFVPTGNGPKIGYSIADKLDTYLVGKSKTTVSGNTTQFQNSSLSSLGIDKENSALFRFSYSIPFNYYGAY